ncbi:MAG: glutamine-hydrolyzing GMP synthase [Pseudomonadales bacterium]|nr:glutamine-hydrolyzing GMP synthase [Pseudomonadales bacterium]
MSHTSDPHVQRILILDFGSQYTQLIARGIRELNVYCEILPFDADIGRIKAFNPAGIVLSGGPATVTESDTPRADDEIFNLDCPVLGICYGMQTMAAQLGGEVETAKQREYGFAEVRPISASPLIDGLHDRLDADGAGVLKVWMSHGDRVNTLPEGFRVLAVSENAPIAAIGNLDRRFFGVQFHPEVTHTNQGRAMMKRFVRDICGCTGDWTPANIIDGLLSRVTDEVGSDGVVLGLSGGVDSSVVAALLHRAIGDQLTCIFVDNGLLRQGEVKQVMETFKDGFGIRIVQVDASERFLEALSGIVDPEDKRRVIGSVFVDVFQEEADKIENICWLAQGTIYPDVIESAGTNTGKARVIKSHHNVGGIPDTLKLQLLEPLRELFKDEVRAVGVALGLPKSIVYRHPFPGPGLGVRILGEVRQEYADILRQADAIFLDELRRSDLYDSTSQAFAVFLPVRSVGVVGDNRSYEFVISLRAVETTDFMTADWKRLPYEVLARVSTRIINEVRSVSRVTYDISSKPPATIEWE